MLTAAGSWCAAQNNVGEFLQAEFEEVKTITRMAVQGHHSAGEWVSKISLKYSIDGAYWYNYSLTSGNAVSDPVTVSNKYDGVNEITIIVIIITMITIIIIIMYCDWQASEKITIDLICWLYRPPSC